MQPTLLTSKHFLFASLAVIHLACSSTQMPFTPPEADAQPSTSDAATTNSDAAACAPDPSAAKTERSCVQTFFSQAPHVCGDAHLPRVCVNHEWQCPDKTLPASSSECWCMSNGFRGTPDKPWECTKQGWQDPG